ncbi:neutral/alkaline non-lysosomal ceramidase N-terminal domain-containing protein [Lignipirellula cremea]|uniref:Neutral ceramidase n=1 Tax=Lignipirellula cremea TaxID=2528010 RepID=A0A518DSS7_9BACT|nr:neutral/alkaline non-lysosomal ceramidase N-terminal domain-containing protein [Lignipirellula cremea]QDU94884.1 Neutral ceramidase precursor [Lignipirellula cremea]
MVIRLVIACWVGLLWVPALAAADTWRSGVAKAVITPAKPMYMAGYAGRDHPAEGKLTELWAKALAISAGDEPAALLVTLDLVGIDRELALGIRTRLQEKHRLPLANIVLCTSHTHTGPIVAKNLRPMHYLLLDKHQQKQVDDYADFLADTVVRIGGEALANLAPAELAWGEGRADFAVNRRNNPAAEVPTLRAEGRLRGPFDHAVPVLTVRNDQGDMQAIVFGYACHATVLNSYRWSGDYPGFAQIDLEKNHPGCQAMFWAGCGADQNPLPRRTTELAEQYGKALAVAVESVIDGKLQPLPARFSSRYREEPLALAKLPTREELIEAAASKDRFVASRARAHLQQLDDGKSLLAKYPYPIQSWRLGDKLQWVFLGGEVVVDFALRIRSESAGPVWIAAYSNDVMAYIPSLRVLREGGYEGASAMIYYGLPGVWAETVEETIVKEVARQSADLQPAVSP